MLTGIDLSEEKKFVSQYDPDKENPTVFKIGLLDPELMARINDDVSTVGFRTQNPNEEATVSIRKNGKTLMLLKYGLKGVENFAHPQTGKPVEVKMESEMYAGRMRTFLPKQIRDMIPPKVREEIAEEIERVNELSDAEIKN